MIAAAGYIRCSTDMQAETSPEQQRELILEWAGKHGFQIHDWYADIGKSGTSFEKRPEFRRMLSVIEGKPPFKAVIVLDESRWGRAGADDSNYYKTHFRKVAGVEVCFVRTNARTGNAMGDGMLSYMEGALSREESVKKSERTLDGCKNAVRHGHSAGGTAPYGYKRVAVNRFSGERRDLDAVRGPDGKIILNAKGLPITQQIRPKEEYTIWEPGDPYEVKVVKKVYEWRVKYRYGYSRIAKMLNSEGVPCPKRGKWANKDQKWSVATIGYLVKNPAYKGERVYDRLKKKDIGRYAARYREHDESRWIVIENAFEAIVSPELWSLSNPPKKSSEDGRKTKKRFDSPYLLSGLIKCSHCGFNFSGKAQYVGKTGNRRVRRTYSDSGFNNKGSAVCNFMSFDAEKFEHQVVSRIGQMIQSSEVVTVVERMSKEFLEDRRKNPDGDLHRVDAQISDVQARIRTLMTLFERGVQSDEAVNRIRDLETELKDLKGRKETLQSSAPKVVDLRSEIKTVRAFIDEFAEKFSSAEPAVKKALIAKFVERIDVDRERRVAKCYLLRLPKGISKTVDELIDRERTYLMSVPPRGIEPLYRA